MEATLLIALVLITLLALFDLWVGVANDAVNFLNSAIGSRVATRRTIVIVASFGVLIGALMSSGMMEVARKGVFNPDRFQDIWALLAIFLGVMAADVLLLDLFNSFGLPTSTTVSIVSEMVGASIAVSLWIHGGDVGEGLSVINTKSVLGIYAGIFLSIAAAFFSGLLVMFATRVLYTHDVERTFRRYGWIWTGMAVTCIVYFVLYKGLKKSSVLTPSVQAWLGEYVTGILLGAFIFAAILGGMFSHRPKAVLALLILGGTGSLAMAFAGNDLVNFIGPTVAAFQTVALKGEGLSGQVPTPSWALLLAGAVMAAALWISRKARRVTETQVRLSGHQKTPQRFSSNRLARSLVTWTGVLWRVLCAVTPERAKRAVDRRTQPPPPEEDQPPYDLLRASVNLTVASLLIAIGTAQKLPLSTTYITFMVAMGASLSDRSWPSEGADQRVTGVLTVLGGWLLTGFIAAGGGFLMASILYMGETLGLFVVLVAIVVGIWRLGQVRMSSGELKIVR